MTTTSTLTAYFNLELSKLGYDDLALTKKLSWQLSYSQGDGIDFPNAKISDDDAKTLCDRIMTGKYKAAVKRAIDKGIEISAGGNYSAEFNDYYCDPELTPFEIGACEAFIVAIENDLRDLEKRFRYEGYAYFNATPTECEPEIVIERSLGRLKLVVSKIYCDWLDLFGSDDEVDIEFDYRVMQGIINDGDKFFDLKVEFFDLCDEFGDSPMATAYHSNFIQGGNEDFLTVYRREIREMVQEALGEVRSELGMERPEREAVFAARAKARREAYENERLEAVRQAEAKAKIEKEAREFKFWSGLSLGVSPSVCSFA